MQKIFVYGTLKKSFSAHKRLLEDYNAIFIKTATTTPTYQLYRIHWFPGMVVDDIEQDGGVQGEVYSVTDECLAALDHYEGAPDLFRREVIELADGSTALAYLYNQSFTGKDKVPDGLWLDGKEESKEG